MGRGEDLTNGVTENGEKKEKKSNGVNNLNKDSPGRPQNNVEPDDLKPKKAGSTITKTGKISKTTKPELSKNGLNKAAEEVITPKKTSTVEPMEVDEPVETKAKPTSVKKKNDMPMGSLLKDLPTSGSAPQTSNSADGPPPISRAASKVYIVRPNSFCGSSSVSANVNKTINTSK